MKKSLNASPDAGFVEHKGIKSYVELDLENDIAYVRVPIPFANASDIGVAFRKMIDTITAR